MGLGSVTWSTTPPTSVPPHLDVPNKHLEVRVVRDEMPPFIVRMHILNLLDDVRRQLQPKDTAISAVLGGHQLT